MIPLSNIHRVNFYPPSPAHAPQHFIVSSESCSHSTARADLSQTHSDSPSLDSPLLELEMNSRSRSNFTLHSVAWVSFFYVLYWAVTFNSSEKKRLWMSLFNLFVSFYILRTFCTSQTKMQPARGFIYFYSFTFISVIHLELFFLVRNIIRM